MDKNVKTEENDNVETSILEEVSIGFAYHQATNIMIKLEMKFIAAVAFFSEAVRTCVCKSCKNEIASILMVDRFGDK